MKIQWCHIEDNGIGLGIIHDGNGFIPISYNEGVEFQKSLELMLETCTGDMSYAIECFGNIDFTKMDGQMMLDDLKKIP
ncbi:hypothetical protein AAE250_12135 [Bacteroides sp. GD17]|uniref:hypothetical protein n=1 Tax=Bacteroides sp. GD17 TaxID=3139826 RepID=UPI00313C0364